MAERRTVDLAACAVALSFGGCAPTLDVLGVYFPGWLLCAVAGLIASYLVVWWLGRRRGTRRLADSGLFFLSLATGVSISLWWIFFSRF